MTVSFPDYLMDQLEVGISCLNTLMHQDVIFVIACSVSHFVSHTWITIVYSISREHQRKGDTSTLYSHVTTSLAAI